MTGNEQRCKYRRRSNDILREVQNMKTERLTKRVEEIKNRPQLAEGILTLFARWTLNYYGSIGATTTEETNFRQGCVALAELFNEIWREQGSFDQLLTKDERIQNAEPPFEPLEGWCISSDLRTNFPFVHWRWVVRHNNKPVAAFEDSPMAIDFFHFCAGRDGAPYQEGQMEHMTKKEQAESKRKRFFLREEKLTANRSNFTIMRAWGEQSCVPVQALDSWSNKEIAMKVLNALNEGWNASEKYKQKLLKK